MLIPIFKDNEVVDKYVSIKIHQKDNILSAEIKSLQAIITNGTASEKSALRRELLVFSANNMKTSVLPGSSAFTTDVKERITSTSLSQSKNTQFMTTLNEGQCTTVLTAYYQFYPGSPAENANMFFITELTSQLAVSGIPYTFDYGNANGIAIIGPLGSVPDFTAIINIVIQITEDFYQEDFHLVSQDINSYCTDDVEPPPATEDPCTTKPKIITKVSKTTIKGFSSQIIAKITNSSYEWGAPIRYNNLTESREFVNVPIFTDSEVDQIAIPFTWNSTDGYSVGWIHSHPGGSAPNYTDIFAFLQNNANASLQNAGQAAIDFYRENAFQIVVNEEQNYAITVRDWGKLETLYNEYLTNPTNFVNSIAAVGQDYDNDLARMIAKFGDALNVFISFQSREDLIPIYVDKSTNKVTEIPCN